MSEGWYIHYVNGKCYQTPSKSTAEKMAKRDSEITGKKSKVELILAPGKGTRVIAIFENGKKIK